MSRKPGFLIVLIFFSLHINGQTIRFEIRSVPSGYPADSTVYLAGSFNNWEPKNENYRFKREPYGFSLNVTLNAGSYEYKITRGGWDKVETQKTGAGIQNRQLVVRGNDTVQIKVESWQDKFPSHMIQKTSTASSHVCVLDTAFSIPQLNRTRRVWIYLPADYCESKKKYPVLYMHDGQNVFDNLTSFSGEWGVDEFLDTTTLAQCIVVAIDHGGNRRLNEYNGYDNPRFGTGEGKMYVDFLVHTLRPFINKNYRVKKDREDTWIAGSSMGGLISFYAILQYPKVFGGAGVFSPAFWTAPGIFEDIKNKGAEVKGSIYFMCGKKEGSNEEDRNRMVSDMLKAFQEMAKVSKAKMESVIRDEGLHNEATWRKEFPLFYEWINLKAH